MSLKAIAYVDGFNLYYGALRNTPYRWLDIGSLCRKLLPPTMARPAHGEHEPVEFMGIKYFTAPIKPQFENDHGPAHQAAYMAALREHLKELLTIHEGYYQKQKVRMPTVDPLHHGNTVEVWKSEEKGSDVNLAVCLVTDAFLGRFDVALVVSNDSDLGMAIELARTHTHKHIRVAIARRELSKAELRTGMKPRPKSKVLAAKASSLVHQIRPGVLARCQLPLVFQSGITKPANW